MKTWQNVLVIGGCSLAGYMFSCWWLHTQDGMGGIPEMEIVVALIALVGTLIGILVTEIVGWKRVLERLGEKNLSTQYDDITESMKRNHNAVQETLGTNHGGGRSLTVQHQDMLTNVNKMINEKIGSFSNSNVAGELEKIQTVLEEQKDNQREIENRRQLLSSDMAKIDVSVETLNAFRDLMMKNQEILLEQQRKIGELENKLQEAEMKLKQRETLVQTQKAKLNNQRTLNEDEEESETLEMEEC